MSLKHFIGGIALGATLVTGFFKADELRQLAREEVKDATCVSAYGHLQTMEKEIPRYINDGSYFCGFKGDFDGDGEKEKIQLTSNTGAAWLYPPGKPTEFELYRGKFEDRYKICKAGFKPKKFEVRNVGIDKSPQLVLTFSCLDRSRLQILRQNMFREYEKVLDTEADYAEFADLLVQNISRQHVIVTNTKSKRPITAYMWETVKMPTNDGMLQAGRFVFSPYHSDIQRKKRTLIETAKSDGTMKNLAGSLLSGKDRDKGRLSAYAVMEAIEETANPGSLYMELFEMPRNKALIEYSSNPGSLVGKLASYGGGGVRQSLIGYYFTDPPGYHFTNMGAYPTQALKKLAVHLRGL